MATTPIPVKSATVGLPGILEVGHSWGLDGGTLEGWTGGTLGAPYRIAPRQSPGQSGCYRDAITRRQYAQAQPSDDPPFTWLADAGDRRPYWLLEMFRFGGFQAPTDALESPLAFFLIF